MFKLSADRLFPLLVDDMVQGRCYGQRVAVPEGYHRAVVTVDDCIEMGLKSLLGHVCQKMTFGNQEIIQDKQYK